MLTSDWVGTEKQFSFYKMRKKKFEVKENIGEKHGRWKVVLWDETNCGGSAGIEVGLRLNI